VEWGAAVLRDMGGLPEVEECAGAFLIRGYSCPIGAVVARHPGACRLAELLLSRVIGATVRERCERGGSPRCCFEVLPEGSVDGPRRAPSAGVEDEPIDGDPPCWQHLFQERDETAGPARAQE
jgi:hypothetical protein